MGKTMPAKPILLLTATLDVPDNMINAPVNDVELREKQYRYSLDYWKSFADRFRIVMIDNSNYFVDHEAIGKGLIEYVTFLGNQYDPRYGKGKGELEIIRHLFSQFDIAEDQVIIKVTGRQYVENINKLFDLFVDRRPYVMCNLVKSMSRAEPKLIIATSTFYSKYLLQLDHLLDETAGSCLEDVLRSAVFDAMRDGRAFEMFPRFPRFRSLRVQGDSIRESFVSELKNDFKTRIKYRLLFDVKRIIK